MKIKLNQSDFLSHSPIFSIHSSLIAATQLPSAGIASGNKLYSTNYNYMDFNVDEVGLWVIYSTYDSNNTLVAKVRIKEIQLTTNIYTNPT